MDTARPTMNINIKAFLDMIAVSEGTAGLGDNGYNVLFGSTKKYPKLFGSYHDHPRIKTYETHDEFIRNGTREYTTAAGRYQITAHNFDYYKKKLKLPDFSPASQDAIAIQLIKECKALGDIEAGRFDVAVLECARVWASFPNGCGDQRENKIGELRTAFLNAGGVVA